MRWPAETRSHRCRWPACTGSERYSLGQDVPADDGEESWGGTDPELQAADPDWSASKVYKAPQVGPSGLRPGAESERFDARKVRALLESDGARLDLDCELVDPQQRAPIARLRRVAMRRTDVLRALTLYTQLPGSNDLADRQCGLIAPVAGDPDPPAGGRTAFFLVSGVSGGVEGGLGSDSSGTPRPNDNPCPAPR